MTIIKIIKGRLMTNLQNTFYLMISMSQRKGAKERSQKPYSLFFGDLDFVMLMKSLEMESRLELCKV